MFKETAALQKSFAANPDMGVHVERRDAAEAEVDVTAAAAAGGSVQDDVEIVPDFEFGGLLQGVKQQLALLRDVSATKKACNSSINATSAPIVLLFGQCDRLMRTARLHGMVTLTAPTYPIFSRKL